MEIKISTRQILKLLNVLSWIIFIGLCIEAGGILFNALFTQFINPDATIQFWEQLNFSTLFQHDKGYFWVIIVLMTIVSILKALLFYFIVKLFHDKKLNLNEPFSNDLRRFMTKITYLSLGIGLFSIWGMRYTTWLSTKNIAMPNINQMGFGGADVWLFMCVMMFVIAQIFKRGIEIQSENELTI